MSLFSEIRVLTTILVTEITASDSNVLENVYTTLFLSTKLSFVSKLVKILFCYDLSQNGKTMNERYLFVFLFKVQYKTTTTSTYRNSCKTCFISFQVFCAFPDRHTDKKVKSEKQQHQLQNAFNNLQTS